MFPLTPDAPVNCWDILEAKVKVKVYHHAHLSKYPSFLNQVEELIKPLQLKNSTYLNPGGAHSVLMPSSALVDLPAMGTVPSHAGNHVWLEGVVPFAQ